MSEARRNSRGCNGQQDNQRRTSTVFMRELIATSVVPPAEVSDRQWPTDTRPSTRPLRSNENFSRLIDVALSGRRSQIRMSPGWDTTEIYYQQNKRDPRYRGVLDSGRYSMCLGLPSSALSGTAGEVEMDPSTKIMSTSAYTRTGTGCRLMKDQRR